MEFVPVSANLRVVGDEELLVGVLNDPVADPPEQGEVHGLAHGAENGVDSLGARNKKNGLHKWKL